jgi:cysteinyl-tRNA synthetase
MAKSKGHFVTLAYLFAEHDPLAVRFHLLSTHYRSLSDFSPESLHGSTQGLKRLQDSYREVLRLLGDDTPEPVTPDPLAQYRSRFADAMNDDFNTPQAVATLFDAARDINANLAKSPDQGYLAAVKAFYEDLFVEVLGLTAGTANGATHHDTLEGLVGMIAEQRQKARADRDFRTADALRNRLAELGVVLEDTPEGSRWHLN